MVEEGEDDWPVISSPDQVVDARPLTETGSVSNIEIGDDYLNFDTTAIGVPHLVKISYFPNWTADGADGPFRAAPSLMVVVPTQEHVELHFGRTPVEFAGMAATVAALGALVFVSMRRRRRVDESPDESLAVDEATHID